MSPPSDKQFLDAMEAALPAVMAEAMNGVGDQILQAVRDLNPRNTADQVNTDKVAVRNYATQIIDLSAAAITDKHFVISPPTYRLTVTEWPPALDVLTIRINDPAAQAYDILESGNIIELDVPIKEIFVTASPRVMDDTGTDFVKIMGGNLQIFPKCCSGQIPLGFHGLGAQQATVNFDTAKQTWPWTAQAQISRTAAQTDNLITNIPAGVLFRILGKVSFQQPSANAANTMDGHFAVLKGGGDKTFYQNFEGSETGRQVYIEDTGWMTIRNANDGSTYEIDCDTIGPAGNRHEKVAQIWVIP